RDDCFNKNVVWKYKHDDLPGIAPKPVYCLQMIGIDRISAHESEYRYHAGLPGSVFVIFPTL
ncbi:MAG: hypothetical protein O0W85_07675, partial [Methanocorpusculum sp.]|nr:hypothetical protein [Methanocorpusculum sp.]